MKILLLHSNNIPTDLLIPGELELEGNVIVPDVFDYNESVVGGKDIDTYICEKMWSVFRESFDVIVMPFSLSRNYLEYIGLRVATHIRITPEWNHIAVPILFVGVSNIEEVFLLSDMCGILKSYMVSNANVQTLHELVEECSKISSRKLIVDDVNEFMQSEVYKNMLDNIHIKAPANYATHHSIANEWAVMRWHKIINWGENKPELPEHKDFLNMLYFKYLQAKTGFSLDFDNPISCDNSANIEGIEGKTIVYIDDEYDKGWESVIGKILKNSNAKLVTFHEFNKDISKQQLIENIKSFIDKQGSTPDCYIIDLRLCDEDFGDCKAEELSGIQVAKYIKFGEGERRKGNRGIPIVVFTASNKVWNLKEAINKCNAVDYVVKESPEQNCTNNESLQYYDNFKKAIKKAIDKSCFKEFVKDVDKLSENLDADTTFALNSFIDLSLLDESNTIKVNALNLMTIIERKCIDNFYMKSGFLYSKNNNEKAAKIMDSTKCSMFFYTENNGEHNSSSVKEAFFLDEPSCQFSVIQNTKYPAWFKPQCWNSYIPIENMDITIIMGVLRYVCRIKNEYCNLVIRLKYERNLIAHKVRPTKIDVNELRIIFKDVVLKIVDKWI